MPDSAAHLDVHVRRLVLGSASVLHDVSLRCEAGSHTAILGPNGAGKTSLLRVLVGLVRYDGSVHLQGKPLEQLSHAERARRIAYVPQKSLLQSALSVRDVVMQGRYAHQSGNGRATRADETAVLRALEMTDITDLASRPYPELSGGEQRRVLLARALATEAEVIALDEPTAGLDIAHQIALFRRLELLKQGGRTILTVLHDLRDAERWCERALVLHRGRVSHDGPASLPPELLAEVYGVRALPSAAVDYDLLEPSVTAHPEEHA
jgi:iron complex transport system ATP-binding protein